MATREQYLDKAASKLGTGETPAGSNCQPFSKSLGRPCEAWCADFVVSVGREAGVKIGNESAYTPSLYNSFVAAGKAVTGLDKNLQPGDIVFFDFVSPFNTRGIQHVGIFTSYAEAGYINTIEGNTSAGDSGSQDNGDGVYRRKRALKYIVGAGRPGYEAAVPVPPPPAPIAPTVIETGKPPVAILTHPNGYWIVTSDGGVFGFNAPFYGSLGGVALGAPIIGGAVTPDGGGYWLVGSDGGIFSFGNAAFHGGLGGQKLNAPIIGIERTPDGGGYWLFGADGGVFGFGNAAFHGSAGGVVLNAPVVGAVSRPDGGGYWLVGQDGGVFGFDAPFFGSTGNLTLNRPVVGIAATPSGGGYWIVASDGGIFAFGDAPFKGSTGNIQLNGPIVSIERTASGQGYWLLARDGGLFAFGDAPFRGTVHYGG